MSIKKRTIFCSFVIVGFLASSVFAGYKDLRRPQGFVSDTAGIISAREEQQLESFLRSVEQSTSAEIAVVTVKNLDGDTVEGYAVGLFETWGIGKKGKDNGVLFLVAQQERRMRIEVGYGLEGALPDGLCGAIRDTHILPHFKKGGYTQGITEGAYAIAAIVGKEYNVDVLKAQGRSQAQYTTYRRRSRGGELFKFIIVMVILLSSRFGRLMFPFMLFGGGRRGYWHGGGSFRGGGSSFGSGFGGFGGGFSGGGGASGGW